MSDWKDDVRKLLQDRRAALLVQLKEIDAELLRLGPVPFMVAPLAQGPTPPPQSAAEAKPAFKLAPGVKTPAAVLAVLKAHPGGLTTPEITRILTAANKDMTPQTIRSAIFSLVNREKISAEGEKPQTVYTVAEDAADEDEESQE